MLYIIRFFLISLNLFSITAYAHIQTHETPLAKYLKPITLTEFESGINFIDCIYVINLDKRLEKWQRMDLLLKERNLKANRMSALDGSTLSEKVKEELSGPYPIRLRDGQIGCILSHLSIIKDAYERDFNCIWVLEDDVDFLEDIKQIPHLLLKLSTIDPDWDVFYTDTNSKNALGVYVPSLTSDFRPDQLNPSINYYNRRLIVDSDIVEIGQRFGAYSLLISKKGIKKILDYFTHIYIWTALDIDIHYTPHIREYSTTRDIVSICFSIPISDTENINLVK